MKCYICGSEIGEDKKYCPGCGRVISKADRERSAASRSEAPQETMAYTVPPVNKNADLSKTAVYKPAAAKTSYSNTNHKKKSVNIPDIFSNDPNAPVYTDPHSYDKATADVINYDRTFMNNNTSRNTVPPQSVPSNARQVNGSAVNRQTAQTRTAPVRKMPYDTDTDYSENSLPQTGRQGSVIRDKKNAKPHLRINVKAVVLVIVIIAGIAVSVMGVRSILKSFGIIGESESKNAAVENNSSEETTSSSSNTNNAQNTTNNNTNTNQKPIAGVYTVKSDEKNIFMYKNSTGDTVFATIPNKTVLEIETINGDYGKTVYNSRTGWVKMDDLTYTPDETPAERATQNNETTTAQSKQPGTYTVDTKGSGYVNVRSEPSTNGEKLTTVTDGTTLEVDEVKSGWGHINVDGTEGWIYMEYLTQ